MTSIQTSLSPYLAVLEVEISQDLAQHVDPNDFRAEVRKTLFREVLRQCGQAMAEMNNCLDYSSNERTTEKAESKLARHIGYVQEMLQTRNYQRIDASHQITDGSKEF